MFNHKLSKDDYEHIVQLLQTELTYQEIADKFEVSRERIRQIAKVNNLQGNGAKKRKDLRVNNLSTKLKGIYGQFYENGVVDKSDFLEICKHKFRNKKAQVLNREKFAWTIKFCDVQWNTHCPILGIELDYYAEGRQENSPSFDRINNELGYIPNNVQIISWRANRIKNDGTAEEHYLIAKYLESITQ